MDRVLAPESSKQLLRFLGMINSYQDVFKRRSYILAPLNNLVAVTAKNKGGKKIPSKFLMLRKHIDAFEVATEIIKAEVKLAFDEFQIKLQIPCGCLS